jgi:NitT/TauT family transport system substrate-binding protein
MEEYKVKNRVLQLMVVILATVAFLVLGTDTSSAAEDKKLFEFDFATVPWSDPVYIADAKGFFEKYGLKVNFIGYLQNINDVLTNVATGNFPFGCNHASTLAISISNGFPIKAIAAGWGTSKEKPMNKIIVRDDGLFNSIEDLKTKHAKVAIPAAKELAWLATRDGYGLKDQIEEIVINIPDMENALINKQVDAIFLVIPFSEQIQKRQKVKVIGTQVDAIGFEEKGWPQQYVNVEFAKKNPDIVRAYVSALADACDWARENPDEAGVIVARALGVDESQGAIYNPVFPEHALIDEHNAQFWLDKDAEYGLLPKPITLEDFYTNEYNPHYKK